MNAQGRLLVLPWFLAFGASRKADVDRFRAELEAVEKERAPAEVALQVLKTVIELVTGIWRTVADGRRARHEEQVKDVLGKIRRYSAEAQEKHSGSVSFTAKELVGMAVVDEEERETCGEALEHLCRLGELEFLDRRYYIKGRAPKFGA